MHCPSRSPPHFSPVRLRKDCISIEKTACRYDKRFYGAGDEARTRYLHLGKVALYRMSYTRISNAGMIIADFFQKSRADAKFPEKKSPGGQKLCPPSTHVSNLRGMKQGGNKFGSRAYGSIYGCSVRKTRPNACSLSSGVASRSPHSTCETKLRMVSKMWAISSQQSCSEIK